jgi:hypothetical protein
MVMQPRNDYVLIEIKNIGETGAGIALPQNAIEGKEFIVKAFGDKVKGLEVGDKVLMIGHQGTNYYPLPGRHDLLVIREECVVMRFNKE